MQELTLEERNRRLVEYLDTITGEKSTESLLSNIADDNLSLEGLSSRNISKTKNALEKALAGRSLDEEEQFGLEKVIDLDFRPSHLIKQGWFTTFEGEEFRYLSEVDEVKNRIRTAIQAVGRIDIPRPSNLDKYCGTGFIIGKNLVVTNRHVAQEFVNGVGKQRLTIKPWMSPEFDTKHEFGSPDVPGFAITDCVMVHPYWDMALFKADLPDIKPLRFSLLPPSELLEHDIVVIGYPAFNKFTSDKIREIFNSNDRVKQIAPGKVRVRKEPITSKWLKRLGVRNVDALAHDASTMPGNSGSLVLDINSGHVAGLHFAGEYLVENYAVPGYELARDPRIAQLGVRFSDDRDTPEPNSELDQFWNVGESPATNLPVRQNRRPQNVSNRPKNSSTKGNNMIEITVSNGEVTHTTKIAGDSVATSKQLTVGGGPSIESPSFGYDSDFLEVQVPVPFIPAELFNNDTFKLDGSHLIDYMHFSVCQSKSRKLARFVAWNIDGGNMKRLSRRGIRFDLDDRVPSEFQADNSLYHSNPYDRGHIARRADLTWGELSEAQQANEDSFFFTNIAPQHQNFNQSSRGGLWGELENAILEDVKVSDLKISVIAGPVFKDTDPVHRGIKVPASYWKLVAFKDSNDGEFKVAAFLLKHRDLLPTEEGMPGLDPFHIFQVSLETLSGETELGFDDLVPFDTFDGSVESAVGGYREIESREAVYLD